MKVVQYPDSTLSLGTWTWLTNEKSTRLRLLFSESQGVSCLCVHTTLYHTRHNSSLQTVSHKSSAKLWKVTRVKRTGTLRIVFSYTIFLPEICCFFSQTVCPPKIGEPIFLELGMGLVASSSNHFRGNPQRHQILCLKKQNFLCHVSYFQMF